MSLDDFRARADELAKASHAAATRRAYAMDWRQFREFCEALETSPLPAEPSLVAAFLSSEDGDGYKPATLGRRLAAIRYYHIENGYRSPTDDVQVQRVIAGIRRTRGTKQGKKKAISIEQLYKCQPAGSRLIDIRNRAILRLWFALALRRSEIAALLAEDITECDEGLRIEIRKSQTDQEKAGAIIAVPAIDSGLCPVDALRKWIIAAKVKTGPLFRRIRKGRDVPEINGIHPQSFNLIVKDCTGRIGLNKRDYSGHSMRCAFVTAASAAGVPLPRIMDVSRHKLIDSVRACVRPPNDFEGHPANAIFAKKKMQ